MLLKAIIIILLIALVVSLGSGLVFLFKDVGSTRRTLHSLGVRITLAAALMLTVIYGFFSGQLEVGAPWDERKFASPQQATTPSAAPEAAPPASEDVHEQEQANPDNVDKVPVP
jgi:hypothetical protein